MTEANWKTLWHFKPEEFAPHADKMKYDFMLMLDEARAKAGVPFKITSGYREESKAHKTGRAVDIACTESSDRFAIVQGLLYAGFKRIGIYDRHIHADAERAETHPQRVMWWGQST